MTGDLNLTDRARYKARPAEPWRTRPRCGRSPLRCGRSCGILAQDLQAGVLEDEIAGTKDAPLAVVGARAVRVAVRQARRLRGTTEEEAGRAHVADAPAAITGGKLHEGLALAERDIEIADRGGNERLPVGEFAPQRLEFLRPSRTRH